MTEQQQAQPEWTGDDADRPNIAPGSEPGAVAEQTDEPETADTDVLIERADLGPDTYTLVAKGDPIPVDLARMPRRPRQQAGDKPAARRKR